MGQRSHDYLERGVFSMDDMKIKLMDDLTSEQRAYTRAGLQA